MVKIYLEDIILFIATIFFSIIILEIYLYVNKREAVVIAISVAVIYLAYLFKFLRAGQIRSKQK